ncbi:MAG: hypothetical protein MI756_06845 [Chromatiales bacterium]|nr:hypothetical protein [Chromatiales bacterium]
MAARGYAAQGEIRLEGKLEPVSQQTLLSIEISIPEGWHINTNQLLSEDLIALLCHKRCERWIVLVDDLIEKGLLRTMALVTTSILVPAGHPSGPCGK